MVFQSYALYPHMTVRQNIAFSLSVAGAPRKVQDERALEVARILQLEPYLDRRPGRAFGRTAPARRDRPRARAQAGGLPVRRAAVQSRRQAPRADAPRTRQAPCRSRHDDDLRHPRPDRGDDARRQDRRSRQGTHLAGRLAARALQRAGQQVRRRLHRLAEHEFLRRRRSPRSNGARPASFFPADGTARVRVGAERRPLRDGRTRRSARSICPSSIRSDPAAAFNGAIGHRRAPRQFDAPLRRHARGATDRRGRRATSTAKTGAAGRAQRSTRARRICSAPTGAAL